MAQIVGYPGGYGVGDTSASGHVVTTGVPPVPLGSVGYDKDGNEYRYIRSGAAIGANTAVLATSSATPFDQCVVTTGANQPLAGICTTGAAFAAANECGWIVRRGTASATTAGAVAVTTPQTTAAAGALANSAAGDTNNAVAFISVNSANPQVVLVDAV